MELVLYSNIIYSNMCYPSLLLLQAAFCMREIFQNAILNYVHSKLTLADVVLIKHASFKKRSKQTLS